MGGFFCFPAQMFLNAQNPAMRCAGSTMIDAVGSAGENGVVLDVLESRPHEH